MLTARAARECVNRFPPDKARCLIVPMGTKGNTTPLGVRNVSFAYPVLRLDFLRREPLLSAGPIYQGG